MMDACFNLPDFCLNDKVYGNTVGLIQEHPEIFRPNTTIQSVFGIFPNAIWNGGGLTLGVSWTRSQMADLINFYNYDLDLPLRFTFTNVLLNQEHCFDTYCNMIAELGHNGKNEILVSSPILENYLRKNYPNYKYCRSIIAAGTTPCDISGKYDLTVMQRRMNNNWDYLETIPLEKRGMVEFLCTDPCPDECPRLYTHYRDFARATLEFDTTNENCKCSMIDVKGPFPYHYCKTLKTYISRDMIDQEYLPRGFKSFKISGRGDFAASILGLANYLVKPEYHNDFIAIMLGILT